MAPRPSRIAGGTSQQLAKAALLLSAASPNPFGGAIGTYEALCAFTGIENAGIFTAAGDENKSEAKLAEIREFAKKL